MAFRDAYGEDVTLGDWVASFLRPRYLSLTIHAFIGFYASFKFLFLVFNATSILERWVFELTPFFLFISLRDLQLGVLAASVAATNALLHYSKNRIGRIAAIFLTVSMIASIILALRTSPYYFDSVNLGRLMAMGLLLVTVPLDHFDLFRGGFPSRAAAPEPAYEFWGPEAPEEFDQVMESVDEALGVLESTNIYGESKEEMAADAADILEDLLSTISQKAPTEEGGEEAAERDENELERRVGLFEHRIKEMDDRLTVDPGDIDALFAKATYLAMRRRYTEAIQALDEITRLSPYYPGVWHLKAKVYELTGNKEMADLCTRRAESQE